MNASQWVWLIQHHISMEWNLLTSIQNSHLYQNVSTKRIKRKQKTNQYQNNHNTVLFGCLANYIKEQAGSMKYQKGKFLLLNRQFLIYHEKENGFSKWESNFFKVLIAAKLNLKQQNSCCDLDRSQLLSILYLGKIWIWTSQSSWVD